MCKHSLSRSFRDSLAADITDGIGEFAEIGIDAMMEEGFLKEIPIVSTVISLYHIGNSIHDRHNIKKLAVFIEQLHRGCADEAALQKYRSKIASDEKKRDKELEYILILLDRYISYEKPQMLAKLYLAYLDSVITWKEFSMYAEVVDRFLPGDVQELEKGDQINLKQENVTDALLRLISYGLISDCMKSLVINNTVGSLTIPPQTEKNYKLTPFGQCFIKIIR